MDDVLNYDDMYSSHSEQSGSDSEDGRREEENDSEPEDGLLKSDDDIYPRDNSDLTVQLSCPKHKPGQMSTQCKSCSKALAMIKPEMVKGLIAPSGSSLLERYSGRSDEPAPTLEFTPQIMEFVEKVFNSGPYTNKLHFGELVKKCINLPPKQHEKTVKDLKLESFVYALESDPRYKFVFGFRRDLGEVLRIFRIVQRPLFVVTSEVDSCLSEVKELASSAGLVFPSSPPPRANATNFPKALPDTLFVEDADLLMPLPVLKTTLAGVSDGLSEADRDIIRNNERELSNEIMEYRKSVVHHYMALFNLIATKFGRCDGWFNFYWDMYGHCDATLKDLIRSKFASLFKPEVRKELLGRNLSREERNKSREEGLLGGNKRMGRILGDAAKGNSQVQVKLQL